MDLILSLFPGVGLLDRGFEEAGFCVVRGPDLLWGGDIRRFHPPAGKFAGVIGGPPCQDFSAARRADPTGNGLEMLAEYMRCVGEASPGWFLMENVPGVPDVAAAGYTVQRLDVRASEFGLPQRRLRHFQFGFRDGLDLILHRAVTGVDGPTILASDSHLPWRRFLDAQGLPEDFDLPGMAASARKRAIGNGVALPVGKALAVAIRDRELHAGSRPCLCGCGRPLTGKRSYAGAACRKRMERRRRGGSPVCFAPGAVT